MTRVATIPLQRTLSGAIQRSQAALATTQQQLATGKKAPDLASLGTEAVRTLSARSLVAQQSAHADVAKRLGTTLSLYDAHISSIETAGSDLVQALKTTLGTDQGAGLQDSIQAAFNAFRSALNATEAGVPMFSGSQATAPFTPETLDDLVGLDPAQAFSNDDVRASARVGAGLDVGFGITASELGSGLLTAFRTLAEAGSIGDRPTAEQIDAIKAAIGQIGSGLDTVRGLSAGNGRKQAQMETLATRAEQRNLLLQDIISRNEDADLGQVAIDLATQKTTLEASYSVFGQLSGLSLVNYLR